MYWIVTLNPAVDRTLTVPLFQPGRVQQAVSEVRVPGGKGANVALTMTALGADCALTGAVGGDGGELLCRMLSGSGVRQALIRTGCPTRENVKLYDSQRDVTTEINLPGAPMDGETLSKTEERVFSLLSHGDVLILTGSLPPGVPADVYARWIGRARAMGAAAVLDAAGDSLRLGLRAGPALVKPNRRELAGWLGWEPRSDEELKQAGRALTEAGAEYAAVSLGEDGALLSHGGRTLRGRLLHKCIGSTVGAGDAMVAAMAMELGDMEAMLLSGLAAGGARVSAPGAGFKETYDQLAGQARIWEL